MRDARYMRLISWTLRCGSAGLCRVEGIAGWRVLQGGGYCRVEVLQGGCIAGWRTLQSEVYCVVENIAECPFYV